MRDAGPRALLAVLLVGVLGLLAVAVTRESAQVQTLGVAPAGSIAELRPGQELCQTPVGVSDGFDAVVFNPGSASRRTPAIDVAVRAAGGGAVLGRGRLAAGFDRTQAQTVPVGEVRGDRLVDLCFRNRGPARAEIYGDVATGVFCTMEGRVAARPIACAPGRVRPTTTTSAAELDGRPLEGDTAAVLVRDEPRSLLARAPLVAERASIFRPAFVTPALWWVLVAAVLVLVPAGLVAALRAARD